MRRNILIALTAALSLTAAVAAWADSDVTYARIGAPNKAAIDKLAKYYTTVFGFKVAASNKLADGRTELVLSPGKTGVSLILVERPDGIYPDPVSHVVVLVTDHKAVVKAVTDNGGAIITSHPADKGPFTEISMTADPVGNRIEVLTARK